MKNNEKDSNKPSKNNYDLLNDEDILSSEMSTVFMKDDSVRKQTILCYEQMNLKTCPIIDSNEICHFLSLQYNQIHRIEHLHHLTKLVYLNISDNQLTTMNGLETLYSLRILLLGNNQIKQICALNNLYNLNVLDLNHNQIQIIENLIHLKKLYCLNLSFNYITTVTGLSGLISLTELNLRHNNILLIEPIDNVPKLIWIFLSFNHIKSSINSSTENLTALMNYNDSTLSRNEQNLAYLSNNLSNLIQSNLSLWSIHSDLQYFSPTSTINQMKEGLTHLVLEGILSTTVFNVDDDDNDYNVHKLSNVIENDSKFEKQTNESTENAIKDDDDENEDNEIERKESNHSLKLLNFNRIVKLTIRNVNWNEFVNCISKLHELLPQLEELNLENNQLKYLHQVTDLIDFEYLTALHITGSNGNPIVEQSGQLWRSFIIWSLADSLNLTFLDGKLIKPNEVNESKNLFSLFYERIKMRNSYCTTSNQSFYKRLETVNNISNMMNNKIPMSDVNIDDSGLRLVNSISSPTLPRTVLNSHNNNNINNNNRNIDATIATTSVHTTSTLVNCSRFVEQQNLLLTKKELNNDNEVTRDNSVDSIRRSSSNKFKINESSINRFKQNQSSIHNISPALKQSENFENGLQSNEGKLSIQNQLLKDWPSILKRLIHQAITDNHITTNKL
ncbi:hypothetical protein Smp_144190 [Schistosoma mansoni]|uniref:hypothetical protein n=1 Tax=Schistosoma mansoni TaxID=6183 RepID=UPI0001A631BE|nr:hypothetical protein Smp_144190 [Schistosoma mansoni]|eukprot:XP_018649433.1 hypothetical protein Smp_144190 [Schistosoma mansoni]